MHTFHPRRWLSRPPLPLLLCLGGLGCGGNPDTAAPVNVRLTGGVSAGERVSGVRALEATATDDSGKVARMEFYVSDTLACVDGVARDSGATFSCTWNTEQNAPGTYALSAWAYDAAGNVARSEPLSVIVPPPNRAPTVRQVSTSRGGVDEGSSVTLSVDVVDEDDTALTYTWTQSPVSPAGTFGPETGAQRTWTAPLLSRDTTFTLQVTASDGKGGTARGSVVVTVANVPALNQRPTVDELISASATRVVAGDTVSLFIGARDRDGDALTYAWTTVPPGAGILTNADGNVAQWRSGDLATATSFTFQVTVSDGGESVTRSLPLNVEVPRYAQDIRSLWSPACTDCHNDQSTGSFGDLNLLPESSYASLVNRLGYGACGSLNRVQPGKPDDSLLVQRLSSSDCGTRMPSRDTEYFERNPGELTRIRSWILAGAANN